MIEQAKHYALAITCGAKRGPKDTDLTFSPSSLRDFLKALAEQPAPAQEPEPDELAIAYMSGLHEGKKIGAKEGRNKLATWMMQCGFATGHGDTLEELLYELDTEIEDRLTAIREKGGAA